jgi:hypothetical protein
MQHRSVAVRRACGFWIEWCERNRTVAVLFHARDGFRQLSQWIRERFRFTRDIIRLVIEQGGWSGSKCIWHYCDRRALKGLAHCARCSMRMRHGGLY